MCLHACPARPGKRTTFGHTCRTVPLSRPCMCPDWLRAGPTFLRATSGSSAGPLLTRPGRAEQGKQPLTRHMRLPCAIGAVPHWVSGLQAGSQRVDTSTRTAAHKRHHLGRPIAVHLTGHTSRTLGTAAALLRLVRSMRLPNPCTGVLQVAPLPARHATARPPCRLPSCACRPTLDPLLGCPNECVDHGHAQV